MWWRPQWFETHRCESAHGELAARAHAPLVAVDGCKAPDGFGSCGFEESKARVPHARETLSLCSLFVLT